MDPRALVVSAARDLGLPIVQTSHGFKAYRNITDYSQTQRMVPASRATRAGRRKKITPMGEAAQQEASQRVMQTTGPR
jgi:hypothetical protein